MPQPLSRVAPNANIMLGNVPDPTLDRHPDLALLSMKAIGSWSNVELRMLETFVQLMGGPQETATFVFLALESTSAKSSAITAAARQLQDDHRRLLTALNGISRTQQKHRDKLAHWIWGDSPQLPDAVLLINPKTLVDQIAHTDRNEVFVYRAVDFQTIIADNDRLSVYWRRFHWIIANHPANTGNQLYDQLSAVPEIRERLDRQA